MEAKVAPRRVSIAGLETVEFPCEREDAPTIVIFHGYGADGADLAPLALELPLPRPARWLFPDAPLPLDWGGRAWFAIDVASIEKAQRTGKPVDWSGSEPEALADARSAAGEFIEALRVPWQRLILGGFSQGSMIATDLALRAPQTPRGLVILSGNLVNAKAWRELAPRRKGMPFFMSHGSADPILGFPGALALEKLLKEGGLDGSLLRFEGGHAIPPEAAGGLSAFLSKLV